LGLGMCAARSSGGVLFQHSASANPVTEGWTVFSGTGATGSAVTNDQGFDAWNINDATNAGYLWYSRSTTRSNSLANAFDMSARVRVIGADSPDASGMLGLEGSIVWEMHFGAGVNGDPIVTMAGLSNTSYTLTGYGSGYHLYELRHEANAATGGFFVDNQKIADVTPYTPSFAFTGQFVFGSLGSGTTGNANYNQAVLYDVSPEPTMLMYVLAPVALCARRRRVRN
jgi:hypothetical protein